MRYAPAPPDLSKDATSLDYADLAGLPVRREAAHSRICRLSRQIRSIVHPLRRESLATSLLENLREAPTMSEVLRSFDEPIRDESGTYQARVVGRLADDRMWEGWFEFIPAGGGAADAVISTVESRQPEREHLVYWASGLTVVYAEGALRRARRPATVRTRIVEIPISDAPKPRAVTTAPRVVGPEPVLDPFEVGSKSLDILAQELGAIG